MTADELREVVQRELAGLIAIFAKLLRAGIKTGPRSPVVLAWVRQNSDACVTVVLATQEVAGFEINGAEKMVDCVAEAAFAAAKQQVSAAEASAQ